MQHVEYPQTKISWYTVVDLKFKIFLLTFPHKYLIVLKYTLWLIFWYFRRYNRDKRQAPKVWLLCFFELFNIVKVQLYGTEEIRGSTYMLQPHSKTKETTTIVFGRPGGGTEGGMVLRLNVQDRESSAPGGPIIPYSI